jgi:cytochrome bd-type quinol oxidase subunit 1
VHAGTTLFTLIGFCGIYTVLAFLFAFLVSREIAHGPGSAGEAATTHA